MKTVFFGPFIGEFGWEILYWQGWVRKLCRGPFRDHRRIVASLPGREPLYPDADEFWPLPAYFVERGYSGHAYFVDGWQDGLPGRPVESVARARTWFFAPGAGAVRRLVRTLGRRVVPQHVRHRIWSGQGTGVRALGGPDAEPLAERMLAEFRARLPEDTLFLVPWRYNPPVDGRVGFGVEVVPDAPAGARFRVHQIPYSEQLLEPLGPTERGRAELERLAGVQGRLIGIFPRCRLIRRMDKNWRREKYLELIRRLQEHFPARTVAIFGEPGGAYFSDHVPPGCLDLINVDPVRRLDLQLAALHRSDFALGSISGALTFALAAGCPVLTWGFPNFMEVYHDANFRATPFIYHPVMDPDVEIVFGLARSLDLWVRRDHAVGRSKQQTLVGVQDA